MKKSHPGNPGWLELEQIVAGDLVVLFLHEHATEVERYVAYIVRVVHVLGIQCTFDPRLRFGKVRLGVGIQPSALDTFDVGEDLAKLHSAQIRDRCCCRSHSIPRHAHVDQSIDMHTLEISSKTGDIWIAIVDVIAGIRLELGPDDATDAFHGLRQSQDILFTHCTELVVVDPLECGWIDHLRQGH